MLSFLHSSTLTSIHDHWIKKSVYPLQKKKKNLHKPDNHDGVNAQLEPDTLECEVKGALESSSTNKASGSDGFPVELFQIEKMML